MAKHLLYFQQVIKYNISMKLEIFQNYQAGLTSLEVRFKEWEWEEELTVFTLEEVGLGRYIFLECSTREKSIDNCSSSSSDDKCCWTWNINNSISD